MGFLWNDPQVWSDHAVQSAKSWAPSAAWNAVLCLSKKPYLTDSSGMIWIQKDEAGRNQWSCLGKCSVFFLPWSRNFFNPLLWNLLIHPVRHTLMTSPLTKELQKDTMFQLGDWKLHSSRLSLDENRCPNQVLPSQCSNRVNLATGCAQYFPNALHEWLLGTERFLVKLSVFAGVFCFRVCLASFFHRKVSPAGRFWNSPSRDSIGSCRWPTWQCISILMNLLGPGSGDFIPKWLKWGTLTLKILPNKLSLEGWTRWT